MKKARLLKPSTRLRPNGVVRKFVKYRRVETTRPLECVEMDIKFVWIPERGKQAYLLTLLDVHTRHTPGYSFSWHMKKDDGIRLYARLVDEGKLPEGTVIRSDNGSPPDRTRFWRIKCGNTWIWLVWNRSLPMWLPRKKTDTTRRPRRSLSRHLEKRVIQSL